MELRPAQKGQRAMAQARGAAYLCNASPGASLGISETGTEGLDKETRVLQERLLGAPQPACQGWPAATYPPLVPWDTGGP